MTLTFEHDLYNVKVNQHSKYLGQKISSRHKDTHTPDQMIYLDH